MHVVSHLYKGVGVGRVLGCYRTIINTMAGPKIDNNATHLKAGDALPAYSGKLRLFAMRFCPFAERSVLVLNAKNLPYDLVFVDLDNKPKWIFDFSPKGAVPALEYEQGKALADSYIINVYLDEKYPEIQLQAKDPLRRAQDHILIQNFAAAAESAYYPAAFNPAVLKPSHAENYHKGLASLQEEIQARGTTFLNGEQPGLVDYTIFPFLERFEVFPLLGKTEFAIEKTKYPVLVTYMENMKNSPAVKPYYLPPAAHVKFIESHVKGSVDYNIIDTSASAGCMRRKK